MLPVGRRRTKDLHLLPGVREVDGRWYWRPTTKRERDERKEAGLPGSVTLGDAKSKTALKRYGEVSGYIEEEISEVSGTCGELLGAWNREAIHVQPNGRPRADATIAQYKSAVPRVIARFGAAKYGKTEFEASRGLAIGPADIQQFVAENGSMGNTYLAVLKNAFDYGIRKGRTVFNPCDKVVANAQDPRDREPQEWEVEVLGTLASTILKLILAFIGITGWRIIEVLKTIKQQVQADGVHVAKRKGGEKEVWEWSPEIRRIVTEAEALPRAGRFPLSPLFPGGRRGGPMSYSTFNREWRELVERANALLADGIIDPDTFSVAPGLAILNLVTHDLRSKAHDDAEDAGRPGYTLLGNTQGVARKHYSRRAKKRTPLK